MENKMKATVKIEKSFDVTGKTEFSMEWEKGAFHEFFEDAGISLDAFTESTARHATRGESFTITFTVNVTK